MIELRTFGALDLRDADGRELRPILAQPKRLALLVYLATENRFVRRDVLLGLFWPDSDPARARAALSRAVHYLRSFLGDGVLVSRGDDELGVDAGRLSCDVVQFNAALQAGDNETALEIYRGDFLEGFFLDDVNELEHWIDTTRDALRDRAAAAARRLSLAADQRSNPQLAVHWARRALTLSPYNEEDLQHLMMLLDRASDRAGALDVYERFAKRLREDLDLEVSNESRAVAESIAHSTSDAAAPIKVAVPPATLQTKFHSKPQRLALIGLTTGLVLVGALVLRSALRRENADAEAAVRSPSIAVLPFTNVSGDSANRFFTDGITDEMIGALSEVNTLRVAARTSSFAFRGRQQPVQDIARALNVATVLEGSVRREHDRVRVSVQLVDGVRGYNMWSKTYERKLSDVFALQDEISRDVVDALKIRLVGNREPAPTRTTDVQTYDLYLWGRYYWNERSYASLRKAIEYFERAIARDSTYAPAYTGLADSYGLIVVYDQNALEVMPKARAAADRALALDSTDSGAHAVRAYVASWYEWDWATADRHFKRAIALNPNNPSARHWYSVYLAATGHARESLAQMSKSTELDPSSLFLRGAMGVRLYLARDYTRAAEQLERVIAIDPKFPQAPRWLGLTYLQLGRVDQAVNQIEQASALTREAALLGALAVAYSAAGRRNDALTAIHALEERARKGEHFQVSWIARAYAATGDNQRALDWLERAYEQRDGWLTFVNVDPTFDSLRSEPRFQALLVKMKLR